MSVKAKASQQPAGSASVLRVFAGGQTDVSLSNQVVIETGSKQWSDVHIQH